MPFRKKIALFALSCCFLHFSGGMYFATGWLLMFCSCTVFAFSARWFLIKYQFFGLNLYYYFKERFHFFPLLFLRKGIQRENLLKPQNTHSYSTTNITILFIIYNKISPYFQQLENHEKSNLPDNIKFQKWSLKQFLCSKPIFFHLVLLYPANCYFWTVIPI